MPDFDAMIETVDEVADERLGNTVMLSIGGAAAAPVKAFVLGDVETEGQLGYGANDPVNSRYRIKIARSKYPVVRQADRFSHPNMHGGVNCRPSQWITVEDGRYWLIDMQKV